MSWGGEQEMLEQELADYANSYAGSPPPSDNGGGGGGWFQNFLGTVNNVSDTVGNFTGGQGQNTVSGWLNGVLGNVKPPEVETKVSIDPKTIAIFGALAIGVIMLLKKKK